MSHATQDAEKLLDAIKKIGKPNQNGVVETTFGEIYDETEAYLETLMGTLKKCKKEKSIDYKGEMLFKGQSDKVVITLLQN